MKIAAASGSGMSIGISNAIAAGATTYSAYPPNAPEGIATTRRPSHDSTPAPHSSTTPNTSIPGMYGTGRGTVLYRPWMPSRSLKLSVTDVTRIFSSPSPAEGTSTSSSRNTSPGTPYR